MSKTDERIKACGCPNADLQVVGYMLDIGGGEGIVGQMKPPSSPCLKSKHLYLKMF